MGLLSMMPSAHISRAEAALCLLSELPLHHEAAFREHLPVVLLVCIIKADATVPLVHEHAQQVRVALCSSENFLVGRSSSVVLRSVLSTLRTQVSCEQVLSVGCARAVVQRSLPWLRVQCCGCRC